MRLLVVLFITAISSTWALADDTPYDLAARKVMSLTFVADKTRMILALTSVEGKKILPETLAIVADAFNTREFEDLYVASLKKNFSESELESLAVMMSSPAFRIYQERMPSFAQSLMPAAMPYFQRFVAERLKLVREEKPMAKRQAAQAD